MPIQQVHEFKTPSADQQGDLVRRAIAAWSQTGEQGTPGPQSQFKMHKGLGYVAVYDEDPAFVLAVYRVRPDNLALRRLKRWPAWVTPKASAKH